MKKQHVLAEVLRWIADGEDVQFKTNTGEWVNERAEYTLNRISRGIELQEYRIKPRTVMCNGVEVPAPEKVAPSVGSVYYIPCVSIEEMYKECVNHCKSIAKLHADMDILYLNKEDAIARAKAMLITK